VPNVKFCNTAFSWNSVFSFREIIMLIDVLVRSNVKGAVFPSIYFSISVRLCMKIFIELGTICHIFISDANSVRPLLGDAYDYHPTVMLSTSIYMRSWSQWSYRILELCHHVFRVCCFQHFLFSAKITLLHKIKFSRLTCAFKSSLPILWK